MTRRLQTGLAAASAHRAIAPGVGPDESGAGPWRRCHPERAALSSGGPAELAWVRGLDGLLSARPVSQKATETHADLLWDRCLRERPRPEERRRSMDMGYALSDRWRAARALRSSSLPAVPTSFLERPRDRGPYVLNFLAADGRFG
jgi:hypothetical protein